jgi:hypothetical protein
MDTFTKLFGSLVSFVYHCFDRIVILGYLPLLTRDVHQVGAITKEVLRWAYPGFVDGLVVGSGGASRVTLFELHG